MFGEARRFRDRKYKLNNYSSTPKQIKLWLESYTKALKALGGINRLPAQELEKKALSSLYRGVYVNKKLRKHGKIYKDNIYFAMPAQEGQLTAGKFREEL